MVDGPWLGVPLLRSLYSFGCIASDLQQSSMLCPGYDASRPRPPHQQRWPQSHGATRLPLPQLCNLELPHISAARKRARTLPSSSAAAASRLRIHQLPQPRVADISCRSLELQISSAAAASSCRSQLPQPRVADIISCRSLEVKNPSAASASSCKDRQHVAWVLWLQHSSAQPLRQLLHWTLSLQRPVASSCAQ